MFVIRIGIGSERRGGGTGIISIGRSASLLRGRWRKIRSRWHLASASIVVLIVSFGLGSGGGGTSTIHKRIGSFANGIAPAFQGRRRVASAIAMAHSIVHISAAAHSSSSQLALRSRRIRGASRALRQRVGSGFDAASSSSSSATATASASLSSGAVVSRRGDFSIGGVGASSIRMGGSTRVVLGARRRRKGRRSGRRSGRADRGGGGVWRRRRRRRRWR
mmetsp:Transcript_1976/g.3982  ORF Transcript_1976/g.3982 Transcript_1976/m.3982 type:complete len:220 (-) Transcript_1976:159-818(-)